MPAASQKCPGPLKKCPWCVSWTLITNLIIGKNPKIKNCFIDEKSFKSFGSREFYNVNHYHFEILGIFPEIENSKTLIVHILKFSRSENFRRPICFPTFIIDNIILYFRFFSYDQIGDKCPRYTSRALFKRPWALLRGRGHFPFHFRYNINIAPRILATGPYRNIC